MGAWETAYKLAAGFQATVITDATKATSAAAGATERVQWSKLGVKKCKSGDIASRPGQ